MSSINDSRLYKRLFMTKSGDLVTGQSPNLVIIVAVITAVLAIILPRSFKSIAAFVAYGCFFTWSWGELFEGVNLFRRITGAIGLGLTIAVALFASQALHLF